LRVQLIDDPQGVVVVLKGELDLETAPELDRQLAGIDLAPGSRLVLDLRAVEFMDSTGLSSLIGAQRDADSNGHGLVLRRGSHQVQRLFELTTTTDRFTFES
jgi:anti-anti-sigma factor